MGAADGGVGVTFRRCRGERRRSGGRLVASVDGVVESQSGKSIGESLVGTLLLLRRLKPEPQLNTRFQLIKVFVGDALAPLLLLPAVAFTAVPSLVAVGVRGPRLLLEERVRRHDHGHGGRRGRRRWMRWQSVRFRHRDRPPPRAWGFAEVGGPRARAGGESVWNYSFGFGRRRVLIGREMRRGPVETLLWLVRVIITCSFPFGLGFLFFFFFWRKFWYIPSLLEDEIL